MSYIYKTHFPTYTHRGEELFPAGAILDAEALRSVKSRPFDRSLFPFGFSEMVTKDLVGFLEHPSYSMIFREKHSRDFVFSMLKRVKIPKGAIEVVEYFREKDFYTYRHMLVVFAISAHLVSLLSESGGLLKSLIASSAHDLGKCSIPLELLQKTTPLTRPERHHIEHHTLAGYALVHYYTDSGGTDLAARVARDHHERDDGSGYPVGLRSIDKMIEIVIASDIYDALLSPRPYRCQPFDNRTALEELSSKALHGKISKETVQALVASNRKIHTNWRDCVISDEKRGTPPEGNNYGVREEPNKP